MPIFVTRRLVALALPLLIVISAAAQFAPTTTVSAEQSNNTSTADTFTAETNGNIGPSNTSKLSTRRLLYSGSTAKIFAHWMPWYGGPEHLNVGYNSGDTTEIHKQVTDMLSRDITGAVVDRHGPGTTSSKFAAYDLATQGLMHEAEQNSGFAFAIMMDFNALQTCASTAGCDVTQTLINYLNYANTTYFASPSYLQYSGRPVLYFFGQENYTVDWSKVRSGVAGNPIFVFRNAGAFTLTQSDGGFAWAAVSAASAVRIQKL